MPRGAYTQKMGERLCALVGDGLSLAEACAKVGLPRRTVRGWLAKEPAFEHAYELARRERVDALFERLVARALAATDLAAAAEAKGQNANAVVGALRVEVDALKWALAKLLPERFSDHARVEMTGKGGVPLAADVDPLKLSLMLHSVLKAAELKTEPVTIEAEPAEPTEAAAEVLAHANAAPALPAPEPPPTSALGSLSEPAPALPAAWDIASGRVVRLERPKPLQAYYNGGLLKR